MGFGFKIAPPAYGFRQGRYRRMLPHSATPDEMDPRAAEFAAHDPFVQIGCLSTGLAGMRGTRTASDLGVGCSGVSRAPLWP